MPVFETDRKTAAFPTAVLPILLVLSLTPVWGCASAGPGAGTDTVPEAAPAGEPATGTETTAEPAQTEPAKDEPTSLEGAFGRSVPPSEVPVEPAEQERVFLVDEQGRSYYVETLAKDHIKVWRDLGNNQIRIPWGLTLDLVNEDDDSFYYKRYDTRGIEPTKWDQPPTEEELAAVAARYGTEALESDRLRLEPAAEGLPEHGQWRNGFVLADMNGDGHLDLVHGPPRKQAGAPWIFLGDSRGHWKRWLEASFPRVGFDYGDVAVADFNHDSIPDLAVTSHLRGAMVLVGDGKGGFGPWSEGIGFQMPQERGNVFTSRTMEAVDWNADGWTDLLLVGEGPRMSMGGRGQKADLSTESSYGSVIYLNQGDGTWKRLQRQARMGEVYGDSVAVGDFNADGRIDFVTGSNVMGNKTILNLSGEDGWWHGTRVEPLRDKAYIRAVRAADVDGDGRNDLVVAYMSFELALWRSGVDVLLARPDGQWERRTVAAEESRDGIFALDVGDLDGDKNPDIAALTGRGALWVLLGDGKGRFSRELSPEVPPEAGDCRGYHVALVDFDGDGRDEVVAGFAGEATMMQMDECPTGGALRAWDPRPNQTSAVLSDRPAAEPRIDR